MGEFDVGVKVFARDNVGRFVSRIHEAARRATRETAVEGAVFGASIVPVRSRALQASVKSVMFSDTEGGVTFGTDHWKVQDRGGRPHDMRGNVSFFWEKKGRPWTPGNNTIRHPGSPALHFVDKTRVYVNERYMENLRRSMQ